MCYGMDVTFLVATNPSKTSSPRYGGDISASFSVTLSRSRSSVPTDMTSPALSSDSPCPSCWNQGTIMNVKLPCACMMPSEPQVGRS